MEEQGSSQGAPSQTPSEQTTAGSDQSGTEQGSASAEQTGEQPGFISRAINSWLRGGGQTTTSDASEASFSGETGEREQARRDAAGAGAASDKAERRQQQVESPRSLFEGDPNETIQLTRAEALKAAQSWKDSEIARQNRRDQELSAMRANAGQWQLLRDLSDPETGDPDRLMEEVGKIVQGRQAQEAQVAYQAQIDTQIRTVGSAYDQQVVQPIFDALPESIGRRIVDQSPTHLVGVAHRAHLVREGLAALRDHYRREAIEQARGTLRRSDAFRKEVLHEATDRRVEPELIPASSASNGTNRDMNTWIRQRM